MPIDTRALRIRIHPDNFFPDTLRPCVRERIRKTLNALLVVSALFITGCGQIDANPVPGIDRRSTTEVSPVNETPTIAAAPTATATKSEAEKEAEHKAEIVRDINQFLAAEGAYSDEYLAEEIFIYGKGSYLEQQGLIEDDLGLFSVFPETANVQGINLGVVRGKNCVWMLWGTKMGDEGIRVVIPVKIPLEAIQFRVPILLETYSHRAMHSDSVPSNMLDDHEVKMTTAEEVLSEGNKLLGKPILLTFWYEYSGDLTAALRGVVSERGGTEEDFKIVYEIFSEMEQTQKDAFCSFHPVKKDINKNQACGTGYQGVEIKDRVQEFNDDWFLNEDNLSITIWYIYDYDAE